MKISHAHMNQEGVTIMPSQKCMQQAGVVCLLATLCCFLWGSAFPCVKIGYQLFQIDSGQPFAQLLFGGIRFTLAGILVILFGSLQHRGPLVPRRGSWPMIAVLSLFQTILQYVFYYIGMAHTSGVKASIIEASSTFFAILIACFFFHQEPLSARKATGCLIGFAGVILVNLSGGSLGGGMSLSGEGFLLISALSYAVSSSLMRGYSARENPVVLSGYQFVLGGAVMVLIGLAGGGRIRFDTFKSALLLLYMALISAVAYSVWGTLLKYNPVSRIAVFGFMTPVFGVLLSILLLREGGQLPWAQYLLALALVCCGIFIVNRQGASALPHKQHA